MASFAEAVLDSLRADPDDIFQPCLNREASASLILLDCLILYAADVSVPSTRYVARLCLEGYLEFLVLRYAWRCSGTEAGQHSCDSTLCSHGGRR